MTQPNSSQKRQRPTRWYWVRHAPVLGATSELYDTPDEPADLSNAAAFAALAANLPANAAWITSDLQRAIQTADTICAAGQTPQTRLMDGRIAEQHFGDWFGQDIKSLSAKRSQQAAHNFWFIDAVTRPTGGESFLDLLARTALAIDDYNARFAGQNIIAISHGGVIRAALTIALGLEPDKALGISVENLSTTRLDYYPGTGRGGDWRTVFMNARPIAKA
ncbi:MAG: histidine phosphatase family protein [Pseudomonadota bacterium]